MALATSAEAGVIYTSGPVLAGPLTGFSQAAVASVNVGLAGFGFKLQDIIGADSFFHQNGSARLKGSAGYHIRFATNLNTQNKAVNFAEGANIGASAVFHTSALLQINRVGNNVGNFNSALGQFAGLQILDGPNTYYGWVQLQVTNNGNPTSINAVNWAYNDVSGESIAAGEGAGVPEPGTAALSLLAFGSAGVLAWRRRRNAIQA